MIAEVLLIAGVAVVAASATTAAFIRDTYLRLHFLAPVTSLGGPLIGIAIAVEEGWTQSAVLTLAIVVLLAVTGPVVQAAAGRAIAVRDEPRSGKVSS